MADQNFDVVVIGMGYMGFPMAVIMAEAGLNVCGIDINQEKVTKVNNGICPIQEVGLDERFESVYKTKKLIASTVIPKAKSYIISVPTPEINHVCDLEYVVSAAKTLAEVIDNDSLVILESTVRPNTCKDILKPIFDEKNKKVMIAYCPERAIPGNTLHELVNNDRIIGGLTPEASELAFALYSKFIKGNIFKTNAVTAECCKLMENTFRDINIALANEFSEILSEHGVNAIEAINLANKHPRVNILTPGVGVGGHCIAVDPWFLVENTNKGDLVRLARKINNERPSVIAQKIMNKTSIHNNKIGILGLSYKPDVDDLRHSPSLDLIAELEKLGAKVQVCDPFIEVFERPLLNLKQIEEWSDFLVIATNHSCFKDFKSEKLIDLFLP